ncbi:helix-turn-helix domain-containing protein [Streptomyces olivoreticuli]
MFEQPTRFGPELRRMRLAVDMTLESLAQRVHFSKSHLSKVERGRQRPSPELVRLCDAALGASGALVSLAPRRAPVAPPTHTSNTTDDEVWSMRLSPDGASWFQPLPRRDVVAGAAASVVRLGLGAPRPAEDLEGTTVLETYTSLFAQYRKLGQAAGPEVLLPALIAQTHTLRSLAQYSGPRTRKGLLKLASRYAEYIGWLVQETGDDTSALWWTQRAVDMASVGGDQDLAAYALVRRALITLYRGDGDETVALAQQAQKGRLPPRIVGLAAQREAQGHALSGDYASCMRCLDRARVLLAVRPSDKASPVIGTTNLTDPVAMVTGWCLYDLGRPRQAAEVLDEQVAALPTDALRSHARYGLRQALAHAAARDVDRACDVAGPLLGTTISVGSATVATDLDRLERTLARHARNASVRDLAPKLTAALHTFRTQ